jgi:hypothetical protein
MSRGINEKIKITAMRSSSALFDLGLTSEKLAESHQLDLEPLRIQTIHLEF